jgi:hypothetical protein
MRKLLILVLLAWAARALAQEAYTLNATANQVADLSLIVAASNGRTCQNLGQVELCTQTQACTAAGAAGGGSCTAAQARAANARIYPQTQAGREEFVTFVIAAPRFQDMKAGIAGYDRQQMCIFWGTASQGQKDTACAAVGRAAGCSLCP